MHINDIDLNLLRVFDAVYRTQSISRAADLLSLSQPATSHAITRLRLSLRDPLFTRTQVGMRPTERAERMAPRVQAALAQLELGLRGEETFDPMTSADELRMHLTDIGERRFLPLLMRSLQEQAPLVQLTTRTWNTDEVEPALLNGKIHFAIGYLPGLKGTAKLDLFADRYVLLVSSAHPVLADRSRHRLSIDQLLGLRYVAVHSHAQSYQLLEKMGLAEFIRLRAAHFLALAATVRASDLAAIVPREVAMSFEPESAYKHFELDYPSPEFSVSVHWSRRHEQTPAIRWMKHLIVNLFCQKN